MIPCLPTRTPGPSGSEDLNNDRKINYEDLFLLSRIYGNQGQDITSDMDLVRDFVIDKNDLLLFINLWHAGDADRK